eukprot:TRINITY_DN547_c1_g1_i1.p1 TRINITY_DN547_c1_g1~~TRINITY_DN547_c1_g1_i1.p1  ORF type:complete len:858 (-),score=105.22 TRINITY_DN547_c1_g1_i1:196-2769(-)
MPSIPFIISAGKGLCSQCLISSSISILRHGNRLRMMSGIDSGAMMHSLRPTKCAQMTLTEKPIVTSISRLEGIKFCNSSANTRFSQLNVLSSSSIPDSKGPSRGVRVSKLSHPSAVSLVECRVGSSDTQRVFRDNVEDFSFSPKQRVSDSVESDFLAPASVTWESVGLNDSIARSVEQVGFSRPSAVQAAAIPSIVEGDDVVLAAQTGSGKTHAYLLPIIQLLTTSRQCDSNSTTTSSSSSSISSSSSSLDGFAPEPSLFSSENVDTNVDDQNSGVRRRGLSFDSQSSGFGGQPGQERFGWPTSPQRGDGVSQQRKPFALVLCPNATLCLQVVEMARALLSKQSSGGESLLLVQSLAGGEAWPLRPPDICVATAAALLNNLFSYDAKHRRRTAFVRDVKHVIVDEADMLLSGGYARDVGRLLAMFRLEEKQLSLSIDTSSSALDRRGSLSFTSTPASETQNDLPWTDFSPPADTDKRRPNQTTGSESASSEDANPSGTGAESFAGRDTEDRKEEGRVEDERGAGGLQTGRQVASGILEEEEDEEVEEKEDYSWADAEWEEGMTGVDPGVAYGQSLLPTSSNSGRENSGQGFGGASAGEGGGKKAYAGGWRRMKREYTRSKQYVFVAATVPASGKRTVGETLRRQFPEAVWINGNLLHRNSPLLQQFWKEVTPETRLSSLLSSINTPLPSSPHADNQPPPGIMVFANSTDAVEAIGRVLSQNGVSCLLFHRDVVLEERSATLREMRERGGVLVCTDAAARGVDIPNVMHVIQAEFSLSAVDYLHRIGRTGRAGQPGRVTNLFAPTSRLLVEAVRTAVEAGDPVEGAFSRKRSFRKKFKKYGVGRQGPIGSARGPSDNY